MSSVLRRSISFIFILSILFSTVACGKGDISSDNSNSASSVTGSSSANTSDIVSDNVNNNDKPTLPDEILKKYSYMPVVSNVMPIIHINTDDGSSSFATDPRREDKMQGLIDYVGATVSVDNCDEKYILSNVKAEVKARGNYTLNYDKKPIRIKFEKKQSVLGLNDGKKYKNWVLLADWKDLSMLNNVISFYLGNTILGSDGFYTTDFRNVEVYINGQYWGVYLLVEQQEAKDGRMSVPEVEDGYTGIDIGYMFEYDSYYTEERDMPDGKGDPTFEINYPGTRYDQYGYTVKSDINHLSQLIFLKNYLENVFLIMYAAVENGNYMTFNADHTDIEQSQFTSAKEAIGSVIELESLVDTYIINEIACDPDIAWSSFYLSVDMSESGSKKLIFEAPWDFDSAYGIKKKFTDTDKLFAQNSENPWLSYLSKEDWFIEMVKEKWNEMMLAGVQNNTLELINRHKTVYEKYYAANYDRWEKRLTGGNGEVISEINSYRSQGQAADYMHKWLSRRFDYLNSVWQ